LVISYLYTTGTLTVFILNKISPIPTTPLPETFEMPDTAALVQLKLVPGIFPMGV
jgi:hypothetical protein